MSLYYETATLIPSIEDKTELGSLKTRVFASKNLKSSRLQVFALLTEASKWSPILKEIIERSQLLDLERKVSTSYLYPVEMLTNVQGLLTLAFSESCSFTCT